MAVWPLSAPLRRTDRATSAFVPWVVRLRLRLRVAALVGRACVAGWNVMLRPVLSSQLDLHDTAPGPAPVALNVFGPILAALALAAAWWSIRMSCIRARLRGGLISFVLTH